jgi:hypothetical protein
MIFEQAKSIFLDSRRLFEQTSFDQKQKELIRKFWKVYDDQVMEFQPAIRTVAPS